MDDQNNMTQAELKLYNEIFSKIKECPKCKNKENVKSIIMGRPSSLLCSLAEKTNIISFGGCCVGEDSKNFRCTKCKTGFN